MTHQDRISIIITFVIGFVVGAYLYFVGFLPTYQLPDVVSDQETYNSLVLVADAYGGCTLSGSCLAFQLLVADRNYKAVLNEGTFSGSISKSSMRALLVAVTAPVLVEQSTSLVTPACRYTGEMATNYRFVLTYEGVNYTFDTCHSNIDYEGALWQALREVYREVAEAAG